jgi:hypothetical protein
MKYKNKDSNNSLVLSYLELRRAVGIIGIALPFVLVFGKIILEGPGIQPSISDYYYTIMRNVFVGSLCAIGVFLLSYRGYDKSDNIAGNLACFFAVGVALFPTTPIGNDLFWPQIIGYFHYVFAASFLLILAYFSLFLFTKTFPDPKKVTIRKRHRNIVYVSCGIVILISIALIPVYALFLQKTLIASLDPVFWLESVAVIAFGISWLIKGETLLKDKGY